MMTDIEIFVDQIVNTFICGMNTVLYATRLKVIKKYNPVKNNLYILTLELVQIIDSNFLSHAEYQDITSIMHNIQHPIKKIR